MSPQVSGLHLLTRQEMSYQPYMTARPPKVKHCAGYRTIHLPSGQKA